MTAMPFYHLSVPQYHEMIRDGILTENDRCELIRGKLVAKMTIGDDHAACVDRLNWLLNRVQTNDIRVRIRNPVFCRDSEPEPDVSLVRLVNGKPLHKKPQAADILLVIEVADTSYEFDKAEKLPLYAENGIPEAWIVDLRTKAIEIYREPCGNSYRQAARLIGEQPVSILALPSLTLRVSDVLDFE